MSRPSVHVRIQVTVEIDVGVWNPEATFVQLQEQAKREGLQIIHGKLESNGLRIIGSPKFLASMIVEKE